MQAPRFQQLCSYVRTNNIYFFLSFQIKLSRAFVNSSPFRNIFFVFIANFTKWCHNLYALRLKLDLEFYIALFLMTLASWAVKSRGSHSVMVWRWKQGTHQVRKDLFLGVQVFSQWRKKNAQGHSSSANRAPIPKTWLTGSWPWAQLRRAPRQGQASLGTQPDLPRKPSTCSSSAANHTHSSRDTSS